MDHYVKATTELGYDLRAWIPILRTGKRLLPRKSASVQDRTVDV
jgi:hypothetical protein